MFITLYMQGYIILAMGIGKNIKKLRLSRGVTLTELAKAVGVDTQAIYALEKRDSKKSSFAVELAEFFKISVKSLMSEDFSDVPVSVPTPAPANSSTSAQAGTLNPAASTTALVYLDLQELILITKYREASEIGRGLIRTAADSATARNTDFGISQVNPPAL